MKNVISNNRQPLVSIISPCYNGEKTVFRLLDSILNQSYKNIEFIFINDGSTDNTEKIVLSYENKFKEKKIKFIYVYQENKGLGGAINTGLKLFTGDYLCWPDSDDFLDEYSIEKRVLYLENNNDYGIVSSDANVFNEEDLSVPISRIANRLKNKFETNHFEYLIEEKSIFCSGCHMIRATAFLDVNPDRCIYPARRGQNWQMLLPIYYNYKRGYLDEPLYNYIVYKNSMSRGDNNFNKAFGRAKEHEKILIETINNIKMPYNEKKRYLDLVKKRYTRKKLYIASEYGKFNVMTEQYNILKKYRWVSFKDKTKYYVGINRFLSFIIKKLKYLKSFLR